MLVNTCAVRDNAEQRVIGRMGELQRHKRPGDVLGVVGCMAQRLGPALLEQVPAGGPRGRPGRLSQSAGAARPGAARASGPPTPSSAPGSTTRTCPPVREKGPTAFVTVQRGCDYRCTFCIVPYTRGPERSRRLDDVVREVADARREQGTTEVTLLGQTVNSYHDGQHDFADLLRAVGAVDGHPPAAVHQPVSDRLHASGSSRRWPRRRRCASTCTCRCRAARTRCSGACCGATPASATWRWWPQLRSGDSRHHVLHRHHRRLPGRDRGAVRGDAEPGRRGGFRRRLHLQVLGARGHAGGAPARSRSGRRGVGAAGAAHRGGPRQGAPEERARASGEMHEVLVERPARRGDLMLARTRTNHLVLLDLPPCRGRRVPSRAGSPAPPAPPSPARSSRPTLAVL